MIESSFDERAGKQLGQALQEDYRYLARAFQLARRGRFTVSPNPMVGSVIVAGTEVVGEGWHQRAGEAHAEIHALQQAADKARGATAYVTLEPCNHTGRTGPCAQALIDAGVARVVIAAADANPQAAGGAERLKQAGIEVVFVGPWADINVGFNQRLRTAKPRVVMKLAASTDGRTAMASGESQWITGPEARYQTQRLRAAACAVITGVASILSDDSRLNVRPETWLEAYAPLPVRQPLRVVLDSQLRTPSDAEVLNGACVLAHTRGTPSDIARLESVGAELLPLPGAADGVDLAALLAWLAGDKQCNQVLIEAGARLSGQFIQQGLVDELHLFSAPTLMGSQARPLFELPIETMAAQLRLNCTDIRHVGNDLWQIYTKSGD